MYKIVSVKISKYNIDSIEKLVGENGLYPSRSELVRVALRNYINRELKKSGKIEVPKIIETTNYITGKIRISKENRDLIFIEGFGLVQKIKDIP